MKLTLSTPAKSLNKAYLKQSLKREQIELFRTNLARMFEHIRTGTDEHEERLKNIVADFYGLTDDEIALVEGASAKGGTP
jgi:adenine-specific DNA-methyltransferase